MADTGLDPNVDWAFVAKMLERWPGHTWAAGIPELRDLMVRATQEEWSPELFESQLRSSNWWKTTEPKVRSWIQLEGADPAAAQAQLAQQKTVVERLVAELGFSGTASHESANHIAYLSLSQGWDEQRLREAVADTWGPQPGTYSGVRSLAQRYLVDVNQGDLADLTKRLFTGQLTEQGLQGLFQQRALAKFPHLADIMKSGAAPMDYFADYVSMISQYTDTPAAQVDLVRDKQWSKILSHNDGGQLRPMTYNEAVRMVRSTNQFAESRMGREETATFVDSLTTALGTRK